MEAEVAYEQLAYSVEDRVALLTMNRPEKLNALSPQLWEEIEDGLRPTDADPDVRSVVLTGAGRAFSAGIDMSIPPGELPQRRGLLDWYEAEQQGEARHRLFRDMTKPVIAAVNGYSVAWGFELAVMYDFIITSEEGKFGAPEIRHGSIVGTMLPYLVGIQHARYLMYTGDLIDANEAYRIGLALRVVPSDELMPAAMRLAKRLASIPPIALRLNKRSLDGVQDMSGPKNSLEYSHLVDAVCHTLQYEAESADGRNLQELREREGLKAFLEARDGPFREPVF